MKNLLLSLGLLTATTLAAAAPTSPLGNFEATEISKSTAERIYKNMKTEVNFKSICANRAMVWAYEAKQDFGVDSEKIFIHYTDVYNHAIHNEATHIENCFFGFCLSGGKIKGWEYHVATVFNVEGEKKAFDKHFMKKGPVSPQAWTDNFTNQAEKLLNTSAHKLINKLKANIRKSKAAIASASQAVECDSLFDDYCDDGPNVNIEEERAKIQKDTAALNLIKNTPKVNGKYRVKCKEIEHIAEHDLDQTNAWCHTQRTSMYYWTQLSLRLLNNNSMDIITPQNYSKRNQRAGAKHELYRFDLEQVQQSYRQAFPQELGRDVD